MHLPLVAHALHHTAVAVGQEGQRGRLLRVGGRSAGRGLRPVVVVLHNHQLVAAAQLVLAVKDGAPYALVVDVGALVRTGDDDGVVQSGVAVAGGQLLDELVARHEGDVGVAVGLYLGQDGVVVVERTAQSGGVVEDARRLCLAQHLAEVGLVYAQPVGR